MQQSTTYCRLIGIFFFFFAIKGAAQEIQVSGLVSGEDGLPLIGVNIILKGDGSVGTISDFDGSFEIEVPSASSTLIFQYLGYQSQEVALGEDNSLLVTMYPDSEMLEEVQITALGIKRQKREIGYSTEDFEGDLIQISNAPNVVNALSGRSAGVQITSPNGVDGGTTRITIRGNNNLTADNQPLIIVDGVPLQNDPGLENIGRGTDWGSAINNINPADIESMNVLKGPTASALYGSRGANGVIIITTKRGTKRKGIGIDYTIQHKIIQPYRYRDVQNVYGAGGPSSFLEPTFNLDPDNVESHLTTSEFYPDNGPLGEAATSSFGFYGTGVSWGPEMDGRMIRWWDGVMRPYDPQPDNIKSFFDTGRTITHNLAFSGGGEMGTMRVSLSRTDHKAVIPNSEFYQNTINIGANLNISPKLRSDISINYINYNRLNSPTLGDDHDNSFTKGVLYSFPRSYKGLEKELYKLSDGSRNEYDGRFPYLYSGQYIWWNIFNNNTTLDRNKLLGALSLTFDATSWLSITGRMGMDLTLNQFETRNNPINSLGIEEGSYENELTRDIVQNNEILMTASEEDLFGSDVKASLSLGAAQWSRSQYGIKAGSDNWVNPWLFSFNNTASKLDVELPEEFRFDKKINSVFSFLNLGYKDYLFVELTGRNDWSSALPLDNNSYFYPSASVSFIPSQLFDLGWRELSFLKCRAAYAETATDTDPFQLDRVYDVGTFGNNETASAQDVLPPLRLKPQRARSYEVGVTAGLFDDKVNLDLTYYRINSTEQILDAPAPASSGAANIRINSGELENKGVEAILNLKILQRKNFFWETSINFSRNRNKVVSLGDKGAKVLILADIWGLNGPAIAVREGDDFGTIVGYDHQYHENGQPIINEGGTHYLFTDNRVPIGNASPEFTGGMSMRLGFKNLTLNTLVDTKWGGDIYAGSYVIGLQNGQSPATLMERQGGGQPYTDPEGNVRNVGVILDGVKADGSPNEEVVHYLFKYIPNAGGWGRWLSRPGVIENSWVKLREVTLTYELPDHLIRKTKIFQDLTFSLVGRDLFYLYTTLPDRINPEGNNGSGNAQGLEWASLPGMRSFGFSVKAGF